MFFDKIHIPIIRAFDGLDALKLLNKEQFDIIIVDIMLPKMNGVELIQNLIKNGKCDLKKIVIFSNIADISPEVKHFGIKNVFIKSQITPSKFIEFLIKEYSL